MSRASHAPRHRLNPRARPWSDDAEVDGRSANSPSDIAVARAAVSGATWIGAERVATNLIALGAFIVLGRELDPKSFGLVAAASSVVLFIRLFVDAGFSRALVQRKTLTPEVINTAFWTSVLLGVTLSASVFVGAPVISAIFSEPELTPVTRALSVLFLLSAFDNTQSALVDRQMRFKVQAIRRFIATALAAAVGIALALAGAGVWALVAQTLTLEVGLVIMLWTLAKWRPSWQFSMQSFRELFGWGSKFLGIRTLYYMYQNADNFLIGWILGPFPLGIYVIGYRVLSVVNEVLALTIEQVALPLFSRYQDDVKSLRQAFAYASSVGAVIGWPVYAFLALTSSQLVPIVFGEQWKASIPVMEALSLAGFVQVAWSSLRVAMIATAHIGNELRWNIVLTVASVGGFIAAVHLGVVAVAISLGIVGAALLPWRAARVARLCHLDVGEFFRNIMRPGVATLVMAVGVEPIKLSFNHTSPVGAVACEVLAAAATYPICLRVFAPTAWRSAIRAARSLKH